MRLETLEKTLTHFLIIDDSLLFSMKLHILKYFSAPDAEIVETVITSIDICSTTRRAQSDCVADMTHPEMESQTSIHR